MLTIDLDIETQTALHELAKQEGKTLEQWAKEMLCKFTTPSLTSLIGKGGGCFGNVSEIDSFIRGERDVWED